jgi:hypothetical protein
MKTFHCNKCGQQVFFENVLCENCGCTLGYQPEHGALSSFEAAPDGLWRSLNPVNAGRLYKQCINYAREAVCNWMLAADAAGELCVSCRLTQVIPALVSEQNRMYWRRLEAAKRRLLYSLSELGIEPIPKADDADTGLAFEFLEDAPGSQVKTGHANGVITLNIAEADPSFREKTREQLGEPYRTLLGHFRHESGHYYFDRLVAGSAWLQPFRALFGDERLDYAQALQTYYESGAPPDCKARFVSTYASAHPAEDWAECWAHYLNMVDTLDTAYACGMTLRPRKPGEPELATEEQPLQPPSFENVMSDWFALSYVLNSLNRSVGMPDAYPFTLSSPVIDKLRFVHQVVCAQRTEPGN